MDASSSLASKRLLFLWRQRWRQTVGEFSCFPFLLGLKLLHTRIHEILRSRVGPFHHSLSAPLV